jgi:hypothetical protein
MPLKHHIETLLVVLLTGVTIVTGVFLATLPPVPAGFLPWTLIFVLVLLYPAALYPLLRRHRADYLFRALHFAPVSLVLLWLLSEVLILRDPSLTPLRMVLTWGWSLLPVLTTVVLLGAFCLHVIRRRVPRLSLMALLTIPFIASAVASERGTFLRARLEQVLWTDSPQYFAALLGSASSDDSMERGFTSSGEEWKWRMQLEASEEGVAHSIPVQTTITDTPWGKDLTAEAVALARRKSRLPQSGPMMDGLILCTFAGFLAALHARNARRA